MFLSIIKILLTFLLSIFTFTKVNAEKIHYEDWSGIYYLKTIYDIRKVKHPDFRHFTEDTYHILISTWKGKCASSGFKQLVIRN